MPSPPTTPTPPPPPPPTETGAGPHGSAPRALGDHAATGLLYMIAQTVGVRVVRVGGQVVLAWLLFPDDFRLFALAAALHQFVSVLRNAGLRDILVQRQEHIGRWVNPAFWISVAMGVVGTSLMIAGAPFLAWFFGDERLTGMVLVLAATTFVLSLGLVPTALLHAELRFKTAAAVEAVNNTGQMVLMVLFAWAGLGAMSFVLPMLVTAVARTGYLWWLMRPRVRRDPQLRRWRYLVGDSARLIGADVARTVVLQGDYFVLGKAFPGSPALGHYFLSYRLSTQFIGLLSRNLDMVLFPVLSKIKEDTGRHVSAFVRSMNMMSVCGVPLCFLQAAAAPSAAALVLPERFQAVVPFVVVLSVGMAGQLLTQPATSMLRSSGRFSLYLKLTWAYAAVFMAAVTVAAVLGTMLTAAVAVAVVTLLVSVVFVYAALHGSPGAGRATAGVYAWPFAGAALACGAGWLLSTLVPGEGRVNEAGRVGVVVAVSGLVYTPLIWAAKRDVVREMIDRGVSLARRGRGAAAGAGSL